MKQQADKHHQERSFEVGDWVYLKLQPYAQLSVARRSSHKLSYKYFGPFLVLQRVGQVAYKLQLPSNSQIHPVVHVSQLKKAIPPEASVSSDDDLQCIYTTTLSTPVQIMNQRLQKVGHNAVPFALVQWSHLPVQWMTWHNLRLLDPEHVLNHASTTAKV